MDRMNAAVTGVLAVAVIGVGVYFFHANRPPATGAATPDPERTPIAEPTTKYPVPASTAALPALGESDASAIDVLQALFGDAAAPLFLREQLVRKIVATVDSLPRSHTSQTVIPMKPVAGALKTQGEDASRTIAAKNAERYRPYVELAERANTEALVAAYVKHYPLFQAAYEELGYPGLYFNDRVVEAIDDLLAAPEVEAPVLVQPNVLFEYADPDLERRSSGQKILIRMGPDNAKRVKSKLREIRAALTEPR